MNRCIWCGAGVPHEGMLCCECASIGSLRPEGTALDELLVTGKPGPAHPDSKNACARCGKETVNGNTLCRSCFDGLGKAGVKSLTDLKEYVEAKPPPTRDKSLIWEDCPACALKHLGASYAAVTSPDCGTIYATQAEVLAARSIIAIRECESGYSGNAALAAGCLALAETLDCGAPDERKCWRDARLLLQSGKRREAEELILPPTLAALAGGHIAEALRELPELADRTCLGSLFPGGDFEPDTAGGLRDWLRESIGWICKTYELEVSE